MRQKLLWALARRHVWSTANSTVVRMVSLLSVAGIAIGVAALVILQAFMGGFTEAIASSLTSINPPLHIYVPGGGNMDDFDLGFVQSVSAEIPGIILVEGVLEKPAVVTLIAGICTTVGHCASRWRYLCGGRALRHHYTAGQNRKPRQDRGGRIFLVRLWPLLHL